MNDSTHNKRRMTTLIKAKLNKSDGQTNIDEQYSYRVAAYRLLRNITSEQNVMAIWQLFHVNILCQNNI